MAQVGQGFDAAGAACQHEAVDDGTGPGSVHGVAEQPGFSSSGNAPFILPMSAMKLRFFIAGILILARGFPFAVLKNERQAGF